MFKVPYILQQVGDYAYVLVNNNTGEEIGAQYASKDAAMLSLRIHAERYGLHVAVVEEQGSLVAFAFDPS